MPWTYILNCSDDSYSVGSCRDLEHRMEQHWSGKGSAYTSKRMPLTLVFAQGFDNVGDAYAREKQIQGWSRAKREALMAGEFGALRPLSRKRRGRDDFAGPVARPSASEAARIETEGIAGVGFDTRRARASRAATGPAGWRL